MYKNASIFLIFICSLLSLNAQDAKQIVASFLESNQSKIGLSTQDLNAWKISSEQFNKTNQSSQIYIQQEFEGIEILNAIGVLTILENQKVDFNSTSFVIDISSKINAKQPLLNAEAAINKTSFSQLSNAVQESIATELVYYNDDSNLRLSYLVSFETADHQHYYFFVIDALTGEELQQWDQVLHCSFGHAGFQTSHKVNKNHHQLKHMPFGNRRGADAQYNVFKIPAESPAHGPRSIVSGVEDPIASPYGWHDTNAQPGPEFTTTRGNNCSAYDDSGNNNFQGYAPDGGSNLIFNYPIDFNEQPHQSRDAAITNLFYMTNVMHDFSYRYGFDEQNGNFQQNNYGNGGFNADYVLAEALDGSGTNNANFMTLWDGAKPRMQMYVWNGNSGVGEFLAVNSPSSITGFYTVALAGFGAPIDENPITADLVLYEDGVSPENDACQEAINANELAGKIAVLDRGDCSFVEKVAFAQNAGAIGAIVVNNVDTPPFLMGGNDPSINIPSVMVSKTDGELFKSALNSSATINVTLQNTATETPYLDGDYDNGIIAHEFGHGISTRLVGGRMNAFCLNSKEQMGEGWSDYFALMTTINLAVDNPIRRPIGTYVTSENPEQGFGIRPVPYDTSFAVNSYTYGDITNNEISVPHGVGFIWCTALWDMTWALIDEYGYDEDIYTGSGGNNIAMQLVMDGLKLLNCSPGFVNGRDAILKADSLYYNGANKCIIWKAFAKRGLGYSAVQGSSNNLFDSVEAFDMPPSCSDRSEEVAFIANATEVCDGVVQFEDISTLDAYEWLWSFGDGTTSTEASPTHIYSESGVYTVQLYIESPTGFGTRTETSYITVNLPETPSNIDNSSVCIGQEAFVTAEVEEGEVVWNSTAQGIVYADTLFEAINDVTTIVTVYNQLVVNTDTCTSEEVDVTLNASESDFTFDVDDFTVAFNDNSIEASSWHWDFGDGQSSIEENPSHTYTQSGDYTVVLTINNGQCSSSQIVNVEEVTTVLDNLDNTFYSIVPNPASQYAIIELSTNITPPKTFIAFNAEGKQMPTNIVKTGFNKFQLDVNQWANGVYTIHVMGEDYKIQSSLVVTRK